MLSRSEIWPNCGPEVRLHNLKYNTPWTRTRAGDETSVSDLALGADPGGGPGGTYPPVPVTNGRALNGGLAIPGCIPKHTPQLQPPQEHKP